MTDGIPYNVIHNFPINQSSVQLPNTDYVQVGGAIADIPKPQVVTNNIPIHEQTRRLMRIEKKLDTILGLLTDEDGNPKHSSSWCWKD